MQIIELTESQFKNYSLLHSRRNYFQTIEYAYMQEKYGYSKLYVGLVDDSNNLIAASLILSKQTDNKHKVGYAPGGFLIDYTNKELLTNFTNLLKEYLKTLNYILVRLNIQEPILTKDKRSQIIKDNTIIKNNLKELKYEEVNDNEDFDKYKILLRSNKTKDEIYNKFNRNTKRSITKSTQMGISIHKGNANNIELFYSLIRKKDKKGIDYYKNLSKYFNNEDNKFELYFSKIDPNTYINNYRYLLKEEERINDILNDKIQNPNVKKTNKLINKKMTSDKLITKYEKEIVKATDLMTNYPKGLVVGTCAIIKTNREIYFLVDGYEEKLKDIHSSHMLKWEIMKKYLNEGYRLFNLGEISNNLNPQNNKYYGLYLSKIGFNGTINEYLEEQDLVINKLLYHIYIGTSNILKK